MLQITHCGNSPSRKNDFICTDREGGKHIVQEKVAFQQKRDEWTEFGQDQLGPGNHVSQCAELRKRSGSGEEDAGETWEALCDWSTGTGC